MIEKCFGSSVKAPKTLTPVLHVFMRLVSISRWNCDDVEDHARSSQWPELSLRRVSASVDAQGADFGLYHAAIGQTLIACL